MFIFLKFLGIQLKHFYEKKMLVVTQKCYELITEELSTSLLGCYSGIGLKCCFLRWSNLLPLARHTSAFSLSTSNLVLNNLNLLMNDSIVFWCFYWEICMYRVRINRKPSQNFWDGSLFYGSFQRVFENFEEFLKSFRAFEGVR